MSSHTIKAVILDIEGTTTSISFVSDVLFPYIRRELKNYLIKQWGTDILNNDIQLLIDQAKKDIESGMENIVEILPLDGDKDKVIESIVNNVFCQMDLDRKTTALKQLQGNIWKYGYESGELKGSIYDDVFNAFQKWKSLNIPVYIYSSGSIFAQKLLFGFNDYGNLLEYIKDHFDTTIGMKIDHQSYINIHSNISSNSDISINDILFVTDNIKEAIAAKKAGMETLISIRPGNAPLPDDHSFKTIHSFDEIFDIYQF